MIDKVLTDSPSPVPRKFLNSGNSLTDYGAKKEIVSPKRSGFAPRLVKITDLEKERKTVARFNRTI